MGFGQNNISCERVGKLLKIFFVILHVVSEILSSRWKAKKFCMFHKKSLLIFQNQNYQ